MTTPAQPVREYRYRIHYSRHGASIYQAHLDLMEALLRAVRRSGLPYALTQGCHTRPKSSFGPPLPLGQASRCEFFDLYLTESREPEAIVAAFSGLLPEGMTVLRAESIELKAPMLSGDHRVRYRLPFAAGSASTIARVRAFLSDPERAFILRRGSEARQYVLGSAILAIREEDENGLPGLTVDFSQGGKGQPSVSKIVTALAEELGEEREALLGVERICFLE